MKDWILSIKPTAKDTSENNGVFFLTTKKTILRFFLCKLFYLSYAFTVSIYLKTLRTSIKGMIPDLIRKGNKFQCIGRCLIPSSDHCYLFWCFRNLGSPHRPGPEQQLSTSYLQYLHRYCTFLDYSDSKVDNSEIR
jgi:hypothetical protein